MTNCINKKLYKNSDSWYYKNQCVRELHLFFFNSFVLEFKGWKKEYRKRIPKATFRFQLRLITKTKDITLIKIK